MVTRQRVTTGVLVGAALALAASVPGCMGELEDVNFDNPYGEYSVEALTSACTRSAILAGTPLHRRGIIDRAMNWVDRRIMYSQSPQRAVGGYRTDCSGLVSMAWELPPPGNTTHSFAGGPWDNGRSRRITWGELEVGDALNAPAAHVMLFAGWLDENHTRLCSIEEYNWGRPASILHHSVNETVRGRRFRDFYSPVRFARTPSGTSPDPAPSMSQNTGCYSGTLSRTVAHSTCIESRFDRTWYQCVNGSWREGRNSNGSCTSQYPLSTGGTGGTGGGSSTCLSQTLNRNVNEGACIQSRFDSFWYQCTDTGWVYDASLPGSRRGPIGGCTEVIPLR